MSAVVADKPVINTVKFLSHVCERGVRQGSEEDKDRMMVLS